MSKLLLVPTNISNDLAKKNCAVLHTDTYNKINVPKSQILTIKIKEFILTCIKSNQVLPEKIGLSKKVREYIYVNLSDKIQVANYQIPYDIQTGLSYLQLQVEIQSTSIEGDIQIDDIQLQEELKKNWKGTFFQVKQTFYIPFLKSLFILTVTKTQLIQIGAKNSVSQTQGRLVEETQLQFVKKVGEKIKLKKQKQKTQSLFRPDFKIQDMGIGGLDDELTNIFRRAFASRRFPPAIIQKFGIKHVKGVLLYGPPGTGKTLIARQLAKSLKAKQLTIVNGPEIFSKYVGESQQNIRKLFSKARQDENLLADQSPLHIIVFDQIDAICKQRGSSNNGTNAQDLVVNQLLTNIDGVQALNNILVIGMTNRKDLIDQAVLRPGRFQVHIQVGLPNEIGRQQILTIHTNTLKKNDILSRDINLAELAKNTKNFTGAEIQALVKSASSFAMTRSHDIMDFSKQLIVKQDVKIEMSDFQNALVEVKPQFGVDEQKFDVFLRGKLYDYGKRYKKIIQTLEDSIQITKNGESTQLNTVLLQGPSGTGKTSIAAYFGRKCSFPYVKLISPENFVGFTESGKINAIVKIFEDAYRSKQACIIIDNLQRLLQFIDIGPRFNNYLLQTFLVLIKKLPKKSDCRLLLIGTTSSYQKLLPLQVPQCFNIKVTVPELITSQVKQLLSNELNFDQQKSQQISSLFKYTSIKKFLQIKDMAQGGNIAQWKQAIQAFDQD